MRAMGPAGVSGDGAGCRFAGKGGVAFRIAAGQARRGARAQPLDRGANDEVRQRHPLGGADDPGYEAHVTTPFCGGSGIEPKPGFCRKMNSLRGIPTEPESPVRCCTIQTPAIETGSATAMAASASRRKTIMGNHAKSRHVRRFMKYAWTLSRVWRRSSLVHPQGSP